MSGRERGIGAMDRYHVAPEENVCHSTIQVDPFDPTAKGLFLFFRLEVLGTQKERV